MTASAQVVAVNARWDAQTGISTISIIQKGIIELSRISLPFQDGLLAVIHSIELKELNEIKHRIELST